MRVDSAAAELNDADGWRRRRLSLGAGSKAGPQVRMQYDFEARQWTDAYLRLPIAAGQLQVGQFKPPFSLDALNSDAHAYFTESAASGVFAPGRRLGVQYSRPGLAAAIYGRDLHGSGPEQALALRGFRSSEHGNGRWHVGASLAVERPTDAIQRLRVRPEVGPASGSWLSSPAFSPAQTRRVSLETAWQGERLLLLGELLTTSHHDAGLRRSDAVGGYLTAAWTLRGAPRDYRNGLFTDPETEPFGVGRVELLARYSSVDLPSFESARPGQHGLSLALNAQLGSHWRMLLDRHRSRLHGNADGARVWAVRLIWTY